MFIDKRKEWHKKVSVRYNININGKEKLAIKIWEDEPIICQKMFEFLF